MLLVQQLVYLVAGLVQIQVQNHMARPIWVVVESPNISLPGQSSSFGLKSGEKRAFYQTVDWSGRIWARGWDGISPIVCENGFCFNPNDFSDPNNPGYPNPGYPNPGYPGIPTQIQSLTVAEINLQASNGQDQYDISLVDGFNLPVVITPTGGKGVCRTITCDYLVALNCPPDLQSFMDYRGCESYCNRYNSDEYCCRGNFDQQFSCSPYNWPTSNPMYFKRECPDAYTYKYDGNKGQNTCSNAVQYTVTFG